MKVVDSWAPDGVYIVNPSVTNNTPPVPSYPAYQTQIYSQSERKSTQHRQWIAAIIATCTLFMMGMTLGWSSPVIKKLQQPDSDIQLTDEQISWIVSLLYIGSMTSPLPTGIIMDRYGRKAALYFTSLEAVTAWLLLLFTRSPAGIYAARFIGGMVGGSAYTVAPIYLSEIAEPKVRGALNSVFIIMAYMGVMFEYSVGPQVSYTMLNFLSLLIPVVIMLVLYFIPESPYFYAMKGKRERALTSLAWLRCAEKLTDVETEVSCIEKAVTEDMKNKKSVFDLVKTRGNRKALFITEALAILQRMSGISVIMAYAASAAPSSWVLNEDQCAMLLCLTWILFGFWSTTLVDRIGRRALMIISSAGCGAAMCSYGTFNYVLINSDMNSSTYDWLPFSALLLFSMFFPLGLGSVPNIVQGEVFPANVKGIASGLTSIIIALTSFLTNKMYQPVSARFGIYVNYWVFTVSCVCGILFGIFILIETKGKTLQEIQVELSEGKKRIVKTDS